MISLYCTVIRAYNWRTNQKSVNLEYNMLVGWADWTDVLSTKRLMFRVFFFFHKILQNTLQKPFQFIFFLQNNKKENKQNREPKLYKKIRKKKILGTSNAWSTIHLSHWPIEPVNYILDWRLSTHCSWRSRHLRCAVRRWKEGWNLWCVVACKCDGRKERH